MKDGQKLWQNNGVRHTDMFRFPLNKLLYSFDKTETNMFILIDNTLHWIQEDLITGNRTIRTILN